MSKVGSDVGEGCDRVEDSIGLAQSYAIENLRNQSSAVLGLRAHLARNRSDDYFGTTVDSLSCQQSNLSIGHLGLRTHLFGASVTSGAAALLGASLPPAELGKAHACNPSTCSGETA